MFDHLIVFFDHPFFIVMGGLSTTAAVLTAAYTTCLVIKGILPVWYRLGIALSKRKIVIFAYGDDYTNLKNTLSDSGLFKEKNIIQIDKNSIKKAESESLLLVHWKSYKDKLDSILSIKKDEAALIIYAPVEDGRIENNDMEKINQNRNVIVVNFRGRLINDVLVCMMTSRRNK